jgi:thiol-disulfide isomerase/thioredoxin
MRRLAFLAAAIVLVVVIVVGVMQATGGDTAAPPAERFDLGKARQQLAGSPAPLASLHRQSAELLDGGTRAFDARLTALEGYPVVINKWASWCVPCRAEFPVFQQVSTQRGRTIAFLGVNGADSTKPARSFLSRYPLPYPSYVDPGEKIARAIQAPANYPITVFRDKAGKTAYIHQGQYKTAAQLDADIDRYLRP